MEIDPSSLLCLIAIKVLGGKSIPANTEALKGLKKSVSVTLEYGWLANSKQTVATTSKTGKVGKKSIAVLELTEEGEKALQKAGHSDVLAAAHAVALKNSLESDRQTLRQEIVAAVAAKQNAKPDASAKTLSVVAKQVSALAKKLEDLEEKMQAGGEAPLLSRLDHAFASFQARLSQNLGQTAGGTHASSSAQQDHPAQATSLPDVLYQAYTKLCRFVQFEDGVVEIPRLYHESRRSLPELSVSAFHRELEALWKNGKIELKILNEVRSASEPDKGIRHGDNFYYFIYWKRS